MWNFAPPDTLEGWRGHLVPERASIGYVSLTSQGRLDLEDLRLIFHYQKSLVKLMPSSNSGHCYSCSHFLSTYIQPTFGAPNKHFQVSVEILPISKKSVSPTHRLIIRPTMSQIFKRLISYVGKVKIEQLPKEWQKPVDDVLRAAEKAVRFTSSVVPSLRK